MKSIYVLKIRTLLFLTALVWASLSSLQTKAQIYATSQTNAVTGVCLLCGVQNPGNDVSNADLTDYSTFAETVGLLGVSVSQTLIFPSPSNVGIDSIIIRIGSGNALLAANLFGGVSVQTANGSTINADAQFVAGPILRLIDQNALAEITLKPTQVFDRIIVSLSSDLLGALNNFRIYYAQRKPTTPTAPIVTIIPKSGSIIAGDSASLYGTASPGNTVKWYSAATGGTLLFTGSPYVVHPTVTTTYYAESDIEGSSSTRTPVTITVTPPPPTPVANPTSATINLGDSVVLHASTTPSTNIVWYSAATGGTILGEGSSLIVHPTVTTTYYAAGSVGSTSGPRTPITVTVNPTPTAPKASPTSASIKAGDSATLGATAAPGATIRWYSAATGGTLLFTGSPYVVHPTVTTTYYVESGIGTASSTRTPVTVTVTPIVNPPTITPSSATIKPGDSVKLEAGTNPPTNIIWYSAATGGTILAEGGTITVHPTVTTTYYAVASVGSNTSKRVPVTVTVIIPTAAPTITPSNPSITAGGSVILQASGPSGSIIKWYSAATGGTVLFTGSAFKVNPTVTTTYYAEASVGTNASSRTAVTVTVTPASTIPPPVITPDSPSIHVGDSVLLQASTTPPSNIIWYNAATGGTMLAEGKTLVVRPTATTTYYAESTIGTQISARTAVTVTVLTTPSPISDGTTEHMSPGGAILPAKPTSLSVFPNPTTGNINLQSSQDLAGSTIIIYNMQGEQAQQEVLHGNTFHISPALPGGMYAVRIITKDKQVLTEKIILRK